MDTEQKLSGRLADLTPNRSPKVPDVVYESRGNTVRNLPNQTPNIRKLLGFKLTTAEANVLDEVTTEEERIQEQILASTNDAVRRRFKQLHAAAITDSDAAGDIEQSKAQAFVEARERRSRLKARLRVIRSESCRLILPIVERLRAELEAKRQEIEDRERKACEEVEIDFEPSVILRSLEHSRDAVRDLNGQIERGRLLCPARSVFQPYLVK